MDKPKFENVAMVLGDINALARQGLKAALHGHGFRQIVDTGKVSVVAEALEEGAIDLLVCDIEMTDGNTCELIYKIRHHEIGNNPFIVVITLIPSPTQDLVMRVIDSGSDDLLVKPISPNLLMERVMRLVRGRKRFVVTTDYIGPNRRDGPRPGTYVIPEIEVPNPVKSKAMGLVSAEDFQAVVDRAAAVINDHKMERHSVQIAYLVDKIIPLYSTGKADQVVVPLLDRLQYVSGDISRRLQGTDHEHVSELCLSMVNLVDNVHRSPLSADPKDLKLLPQLAKAIESAFEPTERAAELAHDISESMRKRTDR